MPTIEELFKSKKLSSGKTAEQQYAVRNSKDNELTSAAGLMGLPLKAATAIRRKISTTGKETLVEQETTGLRIISKLSSPIIYGTKIGRFTLQQSDDVQEMKNSTNPTGAGGGLLGGLVNAGRGLINSVKSILGVPQNITPTKIYLNKTEFNTDDVSVLNNVTRLAEIQKKGGGSALGKLIAKGVGSGGTINQLGSNIAGAAADAGKKALKNLLLGSGNAGQINIAQTSAGYPIYSTDSHGNRQILSSNYLFTSFTVQGSNLKYSKYSTSKKLGYDVDILERNDLSTVFDSIDETKFYEKLAINSQIENGYTKRNKTRFDKASLEARLGLSTNKTNDIGEVIAPGQGLYVDKLNKEVPYIGNDLSINGMDFVTLKFYSVAKGTSVNFRATITGLTETFAPSWEASKFIGNPFSFHTYNGIERTIQFNFKVYSLSANEHTAAWERINFLASLVYAQEYIGGNSVVPPFLKFTLGDMFRSRDCFIDSLIYTIDDNNVWETGFDDKGSNDDGSSTDYIARDYKLPRIIDVGVTLKFVESKSNTFEKNLYGFDSIYKETLSPNSSPKEIITAKEEAAATAAVAKAAKDKANAAKAAAQKAISDKILKVPNYLKAPTTPNTPFSVNPNTSFLQTPGVYKGINFGKPGK
jgi:hypothetical protein